MSYLISEKDADRISAMLGWYERNRANAALYKRTRGRSAGGGGGISFTWAKVAVEICEEDPVLEIEGVSRYTMRLASDTTAAWNAATNYVIGDKAIGSDGKKYNSKTGTVESPNVNHNPVGDTTNWEVVAEIDPSPLSDERDAEGGVLNPQNADMRDFHHWFKKDEEVPLITKADGNYYIATDLTRVRYAGSPQSIVYADGRQKAVFA